MRDYYDFSDSIPNPYAQRMKRAITVYLDEETFARFAALAEAQGMTCQLLLDAYLRECLRTDGHKAMPGETSVVQGG